MKYVLMLTAALLIGAAPVWPQCNVDSLRVAHENLSGIYQQPDGRWRRDVQISVICGVHGETMRWGDYALRWDEYPSVVQDSLSREQIKADVLRAGQTGNIDIHGKHNRVMGRLNDETWEALTGWYQWIRENWPVTRQQAITAWGVAMDPLPYQSGELGIYYYTTFGFPNLDAFVDWILAHREMLP